MFLLAKKKLLYTPEPYAVKINRNSQQARDLICAFPLTERGGRFANCAMNGFQASLVGGARFDRGLYLDGTGDLVNLGLNKAGPAMEGARGVTLVCDVNLASLPTTTGDRYSVFSVDVNNLRAFAFRFSRASSVDQLSLGGRSRAADSFQESLFTYTTPIDTWVHIVAVLDYAGDVNRLYLNGSLLFSDAVSYGVSAYVHTASTTTVDSIGALYVSGTASFDLHGSIKNLKFYRRPFTAGEAMDAYQNPNGLFQDKSIPLFLPASGGGTDTLSAEDVITTSTVGTPTLSQIHNLSAQDIFSTPEIQTPTLSQIHIISPLDIFADSFVGTPTIPEEGIDTLTIPDLFVDSFVGTPTLTQIHVLSPLDIFADSFVGSPTILIDGDRTLTEQDLLDIRAIIQEEIFGITSDISAIKANTDKDLSYISGNIIKRL